MLKLECEDLGKKEKEKSNNTTPLRNIDPKNIFPALFLSFSLWVTTGHMQLQLTCGASGVSSRRSGSSLSILSKARAMSPCDSIFPDRSDSRREVSSLWLALPSSARDTAMEENSYLWGPRFSSFSNSWRGTRRRETSLWITVRSLRPSGSALLVVPKIRSRFSETPFSYCAPVPWKQLPHGLRSITTMSKTFLFSQAYSKSEASVWYPCVCVWTFGCTVGYVRLCERAEVPLQLCWYSVIPFFTVVSNSIFSCS